MLHTSSGCLYILFFQIIKKENVRKRLCENQLLDEKCKFYTFLYTTFFSKFRNYLLKLWFQHHLTLDSSKSTCVIPMICVTLLGFKTNVYIVVELMRYISYLNRFYTKVQIIRGGPKNLTSQSKSQKMMSYNYLTKTLLVFTTSFFVK